MTLNLFKYRNTLWTFTFRVRWLIIINFFEAMAIKLRFYKDFTTIFTNLGHQNNYTVNKAYMTQTNNTGLELTNRRAELLVARWMTSCYFQWCQLCVFSYLGFFSYLGTKISSSGLLYLGSFVSWSHGI